MSGRRLSISQARRIALAAQGFTDPAPAGRVDRRHLRRVMGRVKLLQLDSVPVVIRTQYLPPFSRLGCYEPSLLDRIAYRDDEWFEAWAHEASLLPVEDEPLLRWQKRRAEQGETWSNLVELARRESGYVAEVLAQVEERPLTAGELADPRRRDGEWWGSRSLGSIALDWLFRIGAVGIRRRGNFTKEFDLLERIVPAEVLAQPTPTAEEAQRELLVRSGAALGVGTATDLIDYYRLPVREGRTRLQRGCRGGRALRRGGRGLVRARLPAPGGEAPEVGGCLDGAVAVRSDRVEPVPGGPAVGLRLPDRDLRPRVQAGLRLLRAAGAARRALVARLDLKTDRASGRCACWAPSPSRAWTMARWPSGSGRT